LIRKAQISDLDEILKIEKENFETPWSLESFLNELSASYSTCYIYEENFKVIGYIVLHIILNEIQIANISVDKNFQGKRVGFKLLDFVLKTYRGFIFFLEVRVDNFRAIKLYEKFGFKKIGLRKDYYGKGKDAILMKLNNLGVNYA
jgi:ribosomal-protein-alanine N-acetyltransferase